MDIKLRVAVCWCRMTMLPDVIKILSWVQGLKGKNKWNGIEIKEINTSFLLFYFSALVPSINSSKWKLSYWAFSLTCPSLMKMFWNKRSFLRKKSVQLPQDLFGMPIWPPLLVWSTNTPYLRHVKTLYYWQANRAHLTRLALPGQRDCAVTIKNAKIFFFYDLYLAENQTQCPASVLSFEQAWWFWPYVTIFFRALISPWKSIWSCRSTHSSDGSL